MVRLRLEQPGDRPLRCYARRGRFSTVRCEQHALHFESGHPVHQVHAGRDRMGRWCFWPVIPERTFICQVRKINTGWLNCSFRESGGYQCEAQDEHTRHVFGWHTITHAHFGNGNSCEAIERYLQRGKELG